MFTVHFPELQAVGEKQPTLKDPVRGKDAHTFRSPSTSSTCHSFFGRSSHLNHLVRRWQDGETVKSRCPSAILHAGDLCYGDIPRCTKHKEAIWVVDRTGALTSTELPLTPIVSRCRYRFSSSFPLETYCPLFPIAHIAQSHHHHRRR